MRGVSKIRDVESRPERCHLGPRYVWRDDDCKVGHIHPIGFGAARHLGAPPRYMASNGVASNGVASNEHLGGK